MTIQHYRKHMQNYFEEENNHKIREVFQMYVNFKFIKYLLGPLAEAHAHPPRQKCTTQQTILAPTYPNPIFM